MFNLDCHLLGEGRVVGDQSAEDCVAAEEGVESGGAEPAAVADGVDE